MIPAKYPKHITLDITYSIRHVMLHILCQTYYIRLIVLDVFWLFVLDVLYWTYGVTRIILDALHQTHFCCTVLDVLYQTCCIKCVVLDVLNQTYCIRDIVDILHQTRYIKRIVLDVLHQTYCIGHYRHIVLGVLYQTYST